MSLCLKTKLEFDRLKEIAKNSPQIPLAQIPLEDIRQLNYTIFAEYSAGLPNGITREDFIYKELNIDNKIVPLHIYNPKHYGETNLPTVVFFQGSGFTINLLEVHLAPCATIAQKTGCQVIVVDYPLAPEHTAEEITLISYKVTKYLYDNHIEFNIDPTRFIIAGSSAGATISASIVNRSLDNNQEIKFAKQILISPCVDLTLKIYDNNPYQDYQNEDFMLGSEAVHYLINTYLSNGSDPKSPYISPYYQENLNDMPDTTIIVAEYDGLRGDAEAYYQKLLNSKVKVNKIVCIGQTHNYIVCRKVFSDGEDPALIIANLISKELLFNK